MMSLLPLPADLCEAILEYSGEGPNKASSSTPYWDEMLVRCRGGTLDRPVLLEHVGQKGEKNIVHEGIVEEALGAYFEALAGPGDLNSIERTATQLINVLPEDCFEPAGIHYFRRPNRHWCQVMHYALWEALENPFFTELPDELKEQTERNFKDAITGADFSGPHLHTLNVNRNEKHLRKTRKRSRQP